MSDGRIYTATLMLLFVMAYPVAVAGKSDATAELTVSSKDFAHRRARFKFFDAAEGCPSYNDLPGAKAYLGSAKATETGRTMALSKNSKIHVFYFRANQTPEITAKGGAKEIRRRSAQIEMTGDTAGLELLEDENGELQWVGHGDVEVEPAVNCVEKGNRADEDNSTSASKPTSDDPSL